MFDGSAQMDGFIIGQDYGCPIDGQVHLGPLTDRAGAVAELLIEVERLQHFANTTKLCRTATC